MASRNTVQFVNRKLLSSHNIEDFSDVIQAAEDLPAARKLAVCELSDITLDEIGSFFEVLSNGKHGHVPFTVIGQVLKDLLECSDVEVDVLKQHIELQAGGIITAKQFFRAIQVRSVQTLLKHVYQDKLSKRDDHYDDRRRELSEIENKQVERSFLANRVAWRVDRDDAFATLPLTALYLIIFMILVVYHLQVWRRQELERGLEAWISNQAQRYYGPFFYEHIYSAESFAAWLDTSGLPGIFFDVRGNEAAGIELRMGTTNIVVGDVLLRQRHGSNYDERSVWLTHGDIGKTFLEQNQRDPPNYLGAARATINWALNTSNGWVDDDTKDLDMVICTYNQQAEMFGLTEIEVPLDRFGYVRPRVKAKAVLTLAYPFPVVAAADVVYILFILYVIYIELKDMCAAIRLGFGEFLDYWTIWNFIDWTAIFLGFVNIALWVTCCFSMQADSLQSLLTDDNKIKTSPNLMDLETGRLDTMHSDLKRIAALFFALHIIVALNTICIIVKFFKAFQANPRLQTVTMTLYVVGIDVFHFFVVFITIFSSFAVIGHVLFGSDITKFYTLGSSFNTGFTVLMGEFDWYVELTDSPDTLPSGMPRFLLIVWFVVYMFFVLLVMLNMLLAIILERYSEVALALSTRTDARTLWQQSVRFVRRMRETRGFISLNHIKHGLENDAAPSHPNKIVSAQSLQEAFPGMKPEQANWLMKFLLQELKDHAHGLKEDEGINRAKRTERFVQSISEELHTIGVAVRDCNDRMDRLEAMAKVEVKEAKDGAVDTKVTTFTSLSHLAPSSGDRAPEEPPEPTPRKILTALEVGSV